MICAGIYFYILCVADPSPRPSYQGGVNITSYPATPSPHKISDASSGSPSTPETCSEVSVSLCFSLAYFLENIFAHENAIIPITINVKDDILRMSGILFKFKNFRKRYLSLECQWALFANLVCVGNVQ